jgi:hypothetical protein
MMMGRESSTLGKSGKIQGTGIIFVVLEEEDEVILVAWERLIGIGTVVGPSCPGIMPRRSVVLVDEVGTLPPDWSPIGLGADVGPDGTLSPERVLSGFCDDGGRDGSLSPEEVLPGFCDDGGRDGSLSPEEVLPGFCDDGGRDGSLSPEEVLPGREVVVSLDGPLLEPEELVGSDISGCPGGIINGPSRVRVFPPGNVILVVVLPLDPTTVVKFEVGALVLTSDAHGDEGAVMVRVVTGGGEAPGGYDSVMTTGDG